MAEVCGDNPHLQTYSTVNVRLKCKHSHTCTQTNTIFSRILSYVQIDSSLRQDLDREDSSVQKFTFNVQPSID